MKNDEKFEEELPYRFKFDEFWLEHMKVPNIYTLMVCFWPNYIVFKIKNDRGVVFYDTREGWNIWNKTGLWFVKWHEEFGKFSSEYTKVSTLGLLLGPFIQSRKYISLSFTGKLDVMTMKSDLEFEKKLTCQFKTNIRNLTNFDPSTQKSNKFVL